MTEREPRGFRLFMAFVRFSDLWFFRVPHMLPEPWAGFVFLTWVMVNLVGAYALLFRLAHGRFPPWSS